MGRWWRQKGQIHHHHQAAAQGTRSYDNRKPPHSNSQSNVPVWERKFCFLVGGVPWNKVLETKSCMYLYGNVVQWNDSAGEEAFRNAKSRYRAVLKGLPCVIPLPDSDIYIDQIDWNSETDPELILDLEKEPEVSDVAKKSEGVVILSEAVLNPSSYSGFGWGDAEENFPKGVDNGNSWENNVVPNVGGKMYDRWQDGWDDAEENLPKGVDNGNSWENNVVPNVGGKIYDRWQDGCDESQTWNQNQWNFNNNWDNNIADGGIAGEYENNGKNREDASWQHMSRYKTMRVYHDNQQRKGKMVHFAPLPSNRWNTLNSYQPVGRY